MEFGTGSLTTWQAKGHSSELYVGIGESLAQSRGPTAQTFTSGDLGKAFDHFVTTEAFESLGGPGPWSWLVTVRCANVL